MIDHNNGLKISVIIATVDRADALLSISLPSLLRQDYNNFEVIVWDASDGDASKQVCGQLTQSFGELAVSLHYYRAPRRGSASQRNDAVKEAAGDVVFFIDDDCELSCDALSGLNVTFRSFPWVKGVGIPMINKTQASRNSILMQIGARIWGMKNTSLQRKILRSGSLSLPIKDLPGPAEWLSGGSMAYRRYVFEELKLDERLERFGGYAAGEDYDFSHRVMLHYKEPLLISTVGYVIHIAATGGNRSLGAEKVAATFFNMCLIRRNYAAYKKMPLWAFSWQIIGASLSLAATGTSLTSLVNGARRAWTELRKH